MDAETNKGFFQIAFRENLISSMAIILASLALIVSTSIAVFLGVQYYRHKNIIQAMKAGEETIKMLQDPEQLDKLFTNAPNNMFNQMGGLFTGAEMGLSRIPEVEEIIGDNLAKQDPHVRELTSHFEIKHNNNEERARGPVN